MGTLDASTMGVTGEGLCMRGVKDWFSGAG